LGEFTLDNDNVIDISAHLTAEQIAGTDEWTAIVGFNYIGRIIPVTPQIPQPTGSSIGLPQRIHRLGIHFIRSLGVRFGRASSTEEANTPIDDPEIITFPLAANSGEPI